MFTLKRSRGAMWSWRRSLDKYRLCLFFNRGNTTINYAVWPASVLSSNRNIIWTVLYWQRATSSMGTVNKNSLHSPVGPWVCLCVFWVAWFIFMFMYVLFYLGELSHFPSCFGAGVTNFNEPPSSFLLPPYYCGLGAGSIPFGRLWTTINARWGGYICRWSSITE